MKSMARTSLHLTLMASLAVTFMLCIQQLKWSTTGQLDVSNCNDLQNELPRHATIGEIVPLYPRKHTITGLVNAPNNIYVIGQMKLVIAVMSLYIIFILLIIVVHFIVPEGERNSGTNYAAGVLRKAFDPPNSVDPSRTHEYFSADIPVLR